MEVFVLLEGDWRAQFGGQDHLGAGGHLPGPLADGRQAARRAGCGGGGQRCGSGGGGRTGPLLFQAFLPVGGKVSTLESLGNGFHELSDYRSLLLPYFKKIIIIIIGLSTTLFCESFTFLHETIMLFCQPITAFHDNFHILTTSF